MKLFIIVRSVLQYLIKRVMFLIVYLVIQRVIKRCSNIKVKKKIKNFINLIHIFYLLILKHLYKAFYQVITINI